MKQFLYINLIFLHLVSAIAVAQNGKIISTQPVAYSDSLKAMRTKITPAYAAVFDSTETLDITYLSEGLKIKAFVMQSKKAGKYPCIVFCRGGHEDFGKIEIPATIALADIANHGYVVIASQLRGTLGCEGKDEIGGADTMDIINVIKALAWLPKADTSRIGLYGTSRGGRNVLQVLRTQKNIKAAVINSGSFNAFDFTKRKDADAFEKDIYERLIPNYKTEKEKQLILRSPAYWPEKICKTTPLLILHGTADWRTDAGTAIQFANKLYEVKHPLRFILIEGGTHGLKGQPLRDAMLYEWLDKYVKNKNSLPNLELHGE